jgi:hypothetical protein
MFDTLQVLTVLFVAVAMALTLAHALELPGKMRLTKEIYFAMQPIYYPGFTIGGFAEPASLILTIILLFFTPLGSADFWLTLVAMDWQAEIASMFGLQSTLRSRAYATKGNKKPVPFSVPRAVETMDQGFCFPADNNLVQ